MNRAPDISRPDTWDDFSRDYEEMAEPNTSRFAVALADQLRVTADDRVIDIGCGPGALALHLAAQGVEVTAIDHSPAMVARLRRRAEEQGLQLASEAMDGQALAFPDESFDLAFSAFGIFLFPDNRAGLAEAVRVVRPGGRVALATWQGRFGAGPSQLLHSAYAELFPDRPITFPSEGAAAWGDPEVLKAAMEDAGLEHVSVTAHQRDWVFASRDWIGKQAQNLLRMFPAWAELNTPERERLVEIAVSRLDERDPPSVPSTALFAVGQKPSGI
ncbi:MAG TPA: class I SAM-dependent methyltransferase [Allosphingosinicella sp.]|nr:class I SAM-dependent methyltransferase [Allosphingosinicella sp.]